jgi:hypothetical protein
MTENFVEGAVLPCFETRFRNWRAVTEQGYQNLGPNGPSSRQIWISSLQNTEQNCRRVDGEFG